MKKKKVVKRKSLRSKNDFARNVTDSISSIKSLKKDLRRVMNDELKRLDMRKKYEIQVINEKIKKKKKDVIARYEKRKKELGIDLLKHKQERLQSHVLSERKALEETNNVVDRLSKQIKRLVGR